MGFEARLLEKDYFCSVVLEYLAGSGAGLVFKGGTCLSKVHTGFYRLSEDLDFSIATPLTSSRGDRSRSARPLQAIVGDLPPHLPGFQLVEPLRGFNNSTQYNAVVAYESLVDGHIERISIEAGVREPLLMAPEGLAARTALLNPLDGAALVDAHIVTCVPYAELMAEKLRAALSRLEVAIRDFFDIDHAVRTGRLTVDDPAVMRLLRDKLAVPGAGTIDVSPARLKQLQRQVETELRSVLREADLMEFDLDRAIAIVTGVAAALV